MYGMKLDNFSGPELGTLCQKYHIKNPDTDNEVGEPQQFNLMFTSSIGPTGQHPGLVDTFRFCFEHLLTMKTAQLSPT